MAERVRQFRGEAAEFRLEALDGDVFDLLATARALLVEGRSRRLRGQGPTRRPAGAASLPCAVEDPA